MHKKQIMFLKLPLALVCGRSIAGVAAKVTYIDTTPAMLQIGQISAENDHISNMTFVNGFVEELPFPDESFDIVMTRLSFHHFTEMDTPFSELNDIVKDSAHITALRIFTFGLWLVEQYQK